jgi:hypothetical protein
VAAEAVARADRALEALARSSETMAAQAADERELNRLHTLYESNRANAGGSHLLISPHLYGGQRCSDGGSSCPGAPEAGGTSPGGRAPTHGRE